MSSKSGAIQDGQVEPFVEEKAAWQADQLEIKCRHDVAVHPFLFQGAGSSVAFKYTRGYDARFSRVFRS